MTQADRRRDCESLFGDVSVRWPGENDLSILKGQTMPIGPQTLKATLPPPGDAMPSDPGQPPLRLAIIGCGNWARDAYLPNLTACAETELTALCDVDEGRARELAAVYAAAGRRPPGTWTDWRQLLQRERLDLVLVSTLAHARPAIVIAALQAGVHVLAAKPMAPTLAQAEQMLQAAAESDRLLMVGYNYRFRDDAQAVHRFLQAGGAGTPLFARAWIHAQGVPTYAPHYQSHLSAGGALASTGVHPLDLAVWFLGCPPLRCVEGLARSRLADLPDLPTDLEAVRAEYDADDLVTGYVRFEGGVALATESMWLAPELVPPAGVEVWGSAGYARLTPLRLLSWRGGGYVDRTEETAPGLASSFTDSPVRMQRELHHFIDCVRGRVQPLITPREMWTVQAIVEGLYAGSRDYGGKGERE